MSEQAPIHPTVNVSAITPLHKDILVYDMYFGEQRTKSGLVIMDDDKTDRGIHPRWAKVYAVGPENQDDIKPNEWILIEHGRWSREINVNDGIKNFILRRVDPKSILMKCESETNPDKDCFLEE